MTAKEKRGSDAMGWNVYDLEGVLSEFYDTEIIVEVCYNEWDEKTGDITNEMVVSRTLMTLDEMEVNHKPGRTGADTITEFPYLTLYGDEIETAHELVPTEVTVPVEDADGDLAWVEWEDGTLEIATGPFWVLRITPTHEAIRHRVQDLMHKADKEGFNIFDYLQIDKRELLGSDNDDNDSSDD